MAPKYKQEVKTQQPQDCLYEEFKRNAEAISARVYRVTGSSGAALKIAGIVKETGAKKVVLASSTLVESLGLDQVFNETAPALYRQELRLHAADADLGISGMDLAIAETGTLVQDATDLNSRLVSMLPPVHIALVLTDRLAASLRDVLVQYNSRLNALPRYLTFVSGPSRTADIERVLTIGVHGPGELHIIFMDRPGGEAS